MIKPRQVFDSTPLIYLAKTSLLEAALESCEAYTTKSVLKETTEDTNYPNAITIRSPIPPMAKTVGFLGEQIVTRISYLHLVGI